MKTSKSARIRRFLERSPNSSAGVIAAACGCDPSLVHQVKSYDKKQAAKRRSQTVATAAEQSLAICDVPKTDNGNGTPLDQQKISRILGSDTMTTLKRVPTILSTAEDIKASLPPAICEPADIVLSAKALAARCGGVDGLRQLLDAIAAK